jgi:hypothetical protein
VNQNLRLTGIVMTMFDPRTKLSEQVVEEVRRFFGDRVYQTIIPRTVRLSEAPGFGQPITVYDPRSRGAQCYRDLAAEVVVKLPDEAPLPVIEDLPSMTIPPPEPVASRAPRPLVEDEPAAGPTIEESPRATDEAVEVEAAPGAAPEPDEAVEPKETVDASSTTDREQAADEVDTRRAPERAPEVVAAQTEPEPVAQAEPEPAAAAEEPDAEPAVEPTRSIEAQVETEASDAAGEPPAAGSGAQVEAPDTRPQAEAEASGQGEAETEPDGREGANEPRKRRWGLFRKGT